MPSWLTYFIPPTEANGPEVVRWRIAVSVMMAIFSVHILWACGLLPGLNGFASASVSDDIEGIKEEVRIVRKELLERAIFETRIKHCIAIEERQPRVQQLYQQRLQEKQIRYLELTGAAYPLPSCAELL